MWATAAVAVSRRNAASRRKRLLRIWPLSIQRAGRILAANLGAGVNLHESCNSKLKSWFMAGTG
jgi:hypothetical protein